MRRTCILCLCLFSFTERYGVTEQKQRYVRIYLLELGVLEIRVGHANREEVKRSSKLLARLIIIIDKTTHCYVSMDFVE